MAGIHRLAGRKTVILISHRLANVTKADNIYVLDHGHPAGQGTHEALLAQGGLYADLWNRQQALETTERRHSDGKQTYSRQFKRHVPPCRAGTPSRPGHGLRRASGRSGLSLRHLHPGSGRVCAAGQPAFFCARCAQNRLYFAADSGRGPRVLHYAEQGCNHFIAFKLLALIRDKVFGVLRQLAPRSWKAATRAT